MSNNNVPGSNQNVNVQVRALTIDPAVTVQYKTIILKKNLVNGVNTLTQEMMSTQNTKYVVKYDYVLGEDVTVPANCVLEFDGGSISGAHTLTGNNTGIQAGLVKIFGTDITLAGSWNVTDIYFEWFKYDSTQGSNNTKVLRSCFSLQNDIIENTIHIPNSIIYVSYDGQNEDVGQESIHSIVIVKSNTTVILDGIVILNGNNSKWYSILWCTGENIHIKGSGKIIGDADTHTVVDPSNPGQWGYGIAFFNVKNGSISGIECDKCWGDGINLDSGGNASELGDVTYLCENITIKNVKCFYNRREGIIIQGAVDVEVSFSEVAHTATIVRQDTAHGIDIEPWRVNDVCERVYVHDMYMHDNPYGHICVYRMSQTNDIRISRIYGDASEYNIRANNVYISQIIASSILLQNANNITIEQSKLGYINFYSKGDIDNIIVRKCEFSISDSDSSDVNGFINCWYYDCGVTNLLIENSTFKVLDNVKSSFSLVGKGIGIVSGTISRCNIDLSGRTLLLNFPSIEYCSIKTAYISWYTNHGYNRILRRNIIQVEDSSNVVRISGNKSEGEVKIVDLIDNIIDKADSAFIINIPYHWNDYFKDIIINCYGNIYNGTSYNTAIIESLPNSNIKCNGTFLPVKSDKANVGDYTIDTTTNKPIWWTGTAWVDATGATV